MIGKRTFIRTCFNLQNLFIDKNNFKTVSNRKIPFIREIISKHDRKKKIKKTPNAYISLLLRKMIT